MRQEEAIALHRHITKAISKEHRLCLNLGSSTKEFRERHQPHIQDSLINPLQKEGLRFIHCDLKADEGVDFVGDILAVNTQEELKQLRPNILLCSNILEHVIDPSKFATACTRIAAEGSIIAVSMPLSYPYHADPIDTMLRMRPEEIAALFPNCEIVSKEIVISETFLEEIKKIKGWRMQLFRHVTKVLFPFMRTKSWRANADRLRWLFRPYTVSIVILKKTR
jgi:hypothetical protein